jgi:hypothetical protein
MENREGLEFLKSKYNLHAQPEVESAEKRTEVRTGEKLHNPAERIQNYLDRFKEIVDRKDEADRERGLNALKKILHEEYLIKPENIPESYFELQQQIARELGHGTINITPELRKEAINVIRADQQASLDEWVDYLSSEDALYPDWAKYWAFRSVLGMSLYDKDNHRFGNRTKDTTAKFPDLNPEALAYSVDLIQKELKGEEAENPVQMDQNAFADRKKVVSDEDFQKLTSTENFSKYYAFAIEHVVTDNSELLKTIEGEWKKYAMGSDPKKLVEAIQGRGTGWCTAGEATASTQLRVGDFHVYFSENAHGVPVLPRLAIRMQRDGIAEIRGVAPKQEIDPFIPPVLEKKLSEFGPNADKYKQKAKDMKKLTEIDNKSAAGETLTKKDLIFLYEIDHSIQGFGMQTDPRIRELVKDRDRLSDAKILLDIDSQNDEFLQYLFKLSELNSSNILGGKFFSRYNEDRNSYDRRLNEFAKKCSDNEINLSMDDIDLMLKLDHTKMVYAVYKNFELEVQEEILNKVASHEEKHSIKYAPKIFTELYGKLPEEELFKILNVQLENKNYKLVNNLSYKLKNIPARIANILARHGHKDSVAKNLDNFTGMFSTKVAQALIKGGEIKQLADKLDRFRDLDYQAYEELNVANYFNALDNNKESFSEEVRERYF